MKIRSNYVSNSSSSSFIVTKDLTNEGIACLKLTQAQKEKINGSTIYDKTIGLDLNKDFWLTQFISDCNDRKFDIIESVEHILYSEGDLGEECRNDTYYNEYQIDGDTSVYILKEHDEIKQIKFKEFVKNFKEQFGKDADVLVEYTEDGKIVLKPVEK